MPFEIIFGMSRLRKFAKRANTTNSKITPLYGFSNENMRGRLPRETTLVSFGAGISIYEDICFFGKTAKAAERAACVSLNSFSVNGASFLKNIKIM